MSLITVEHRGYSITYAENEEVWRCYAVDFEHASLSRVKARVDKIAAEDRRLGIETIVVTERHREKLAFAEGTATMLIAPKKGRYSNAESRPAAWVMIKGERSKRDLVDLIEDTPENRRAVVAFQTAEKEMLAAKERAKVAYAAIPKLTLDRIRELGARTVEEAEETP
jgi:hypothetical protein